jgi:hypothetical protein
MTPFRAPSTTLLPIVYLPFWGNRSKQLAFAVSSTRATQIDNPCIAAGLYALAGLTFVERIYDDKHWASDALLGAAIGTVIGQAVVHLNRNQLPSQSFSWHCFPVISPQYYGCTIIVAL